MNNITLFDTNKPIAKVTAMGLTPMLVYEPAVIRSIESVKEVLNDGHPVLIRLHSASEYPIFNISENMKLDLESHAVLIIGYDDDTQEFDIVDPWNSGWLGSNHGIRKLPYDDYTVKCVNATKSKNTVMCIPDFELIKCESENKKGLDFDFGLYTPKGYLIDRNSFFLHSIEITLRCIAPIGTRTQVRNIKGKYIAGQKIKTHFAISNDIEGDVKVFIEVKFCVSGDRPYSYTESLSFFIEQNIRFVNKSISLKEVAL